MRKPCNRLERKWTAKYDENSRLLERDEKSLLFGRMQRGDLYKYVYDPQGREIEENHIYMRDDLKEKAVYKSSKHYDEKGNLTETALYKNGKMSSRTVYLVDNKANTEEIVGYDSEGKVSRRSKKQMIEFDRYGNWTKAYREEFRPNSTVQTSMDSVVIYRTITYYKFPNAKQ